MTRSINNGKLKLNLSASVRNTMEETSVVSAGQVSFAKDTTLADGDEDNQSNRAWEYKGTILSGQDLYIDLATMLASNSGGVDIPNSLDLGQGGGRDVVGQLLNDIDEISAIMISNDNASGAALLEVRPGGTAGWSSIGSHLAASNAALGAGGSLAKTAPKTGLFPVTTAARILRLNANGGDVDFHIAVLGRRIFDESSSSSSSSSGA